MAKLLNKMAVALLVSSAVILTTDQMSEIALARQRVSGLYNVRDLQASTGTGTTSTGTTSGTNTGSTTGTTTGSGT